MWQLPDSETIRIYADIFTAALVPLSIYLAYMQIKKTLEWNKKKTAEEAIAQVITGETITWYESINEQFDWSLLTDIRTYDEIIVNLNTEKKYQLDKLLLRILRQLETITIKIEHDVYDESICFDYMFSIVINTHKRCVPYIKCAREERNEPRLFEHVEKYALKWQRDLATGRTH